MNEKVLSCSNCRFFLKLTAFESEVLGPKLKSQGFNGKYIGGCTYRMGDFTFKGEKYPFIVRRYLDRLVIGCGYHETGFFTESTGLTCPKCRRGEVVITRPLRQDKNASILIGCSRYPACNYSSPDLTLEAACSKCGTPLVLSAGDQLVVGCPQCKLGVRVPLLVRSLPELVNPELECAHGKKIKSCRLCQHSLDEKQSLIELELPELKKYWMEIIRSGNFEALKDFPSPVIPAEQTARKDPQLPGSTEALADESGDLDENEEPYEALDNETDWIQTFQDGIGSDLRTGWFYEDV